MGKEKISFYKDDSKKEDKLNISNMDHYLAILSKLSQDERPTVKELASEFEKTQRSVQIYLKKLTDSGFPIYKDGNHRYHFTDGFSLDKTLLDSNEMILLQLALSQFKDVTDFDKITDTMFKKLTRANLFNPYCIKHHDIEDIQIDSALMQDLEHAIEYKNHITLQFESSKTLVEPYRIVAYDGIWYLVAKDEEDQKVKTFLLKNLKNLKIESQKYTTSNEEIKKIIKNTHSAWFIDGNSFEVQIKVYPTIAHYFKAKNFLTSQKITEELQDGSLLITFEVSHDEDIDNIVKSWLPDIEIIAPLEYRQKLHNELLEYIQKIGS